MWQRNERRGDAGCRHLRSAAYAGGPLRWVPRDVPATRPAAPVIQTSLDRTGVLAEAVDDITFGQCCANGEAPAIGRIAGLDAGLRVDGPSGSPSRLGDHAHREWRRAYGNLRVRGVMTRVGSAPARLRDDPPGGDQPFSASRYCVGRQRVGCLLPGGLLSRRLASEPDRGSGVPGGGFERGSGRVLGHECTRVAAAQTGDGHGEG